MTSIMQEDKEKCFLCGGTAEWSGAVLDTLEEHHIFSGNPGRKHSEKYGLKVYLHGIKCHREGRDAVHRNKAVRLALQAAGQKKFEEVHGTREEFIKTFGRNYL